jgi:phosphopantothenoylcysteine decarboxylase/phosphopantothenate--cysteine ligase
MPARKNILLMMSGSIACAKATSLISEWVKQRHVVRVACTASASHFIGRATLEGLSGESVFDDTFAAGRAMDHIGLAQWADLVVVCPASSNLINKFAAGIADDAVSTLWQAAWGRGIPQFVVPAMNTKMWNYPATRDSVEKLRCWGAHILPTAEGDLACGEQGEGRMLEPTDILKTIDALLSFGDHRQSGSVLVTGGGTREPIDAVRYVGNHSTGRTAAGLADAFIELGLDVSWLGARSAIRPQHTCPQIEFDSFVDLQQQLTAEVKQSHYDMIVHAAAVGDYSVQDVVSGRRPATARKGKLASGNELSLRLTPNPKLLNRIREDSCNPNVRVVGFKLTVGAGDEQTMAAVQRLFAAGGIDRVVHNDLRDIEMGRRRLAVYRQDPDEAPLRSKVHGSTHELAADLANLITAAMPRGEFV